MSNSELLIIPNTLSQPELDDIVKYFNSLPSAQRNQTNHFDFDRPGKPTLFVKYGDHDLLDEASTQSFFHALAQRDSSVQTPCIPAVYNAFRGEEYYFIVTERINMPTLSACDFIPEDYAVQRVAFAVKWLLDQMSLVPSALFGRISTRKACVWHSFFKDHQAPVPFVSSEAVAKLINKALSRCRGPPTPSIHFSPDDLSIYHADIRKDNFLLDVTTGRICIVDFQHIGVLPKSFLEYGFFNIGDSFAAAVGSYLGYHPPDIAKAMVRASTLLQQTGGKGSLGLNEFGERPSTE